MTYEKTITILDTYDIVTARMEVREAARRHGLSLIDQACISMATSSIAKSLISSNVDFQEGLVTIECLTKDSKIGVRVISRWKGVQVQTLPDTNERWMVDEIETCQKEDLSFEVILTKWAAKSGIVDR
jgi:anti-sigma regulatory factor (Ser/Thr protein kinase)